jgi:hypothetical protein
MRQRIPRLEPSPGNCAIMLRDIAELVAEAIAIAPVS